MDAAQVREIAAIMFQKLEGEWVETDENFDDGLPMSPIDYAQKVFDLFDEYEVVHGED
ncbi:MAG TPA: hypothetical protein VF008_27000 [Niastella sp.]